MKKYTKLLYFVLSILFGLFYASCDKKSECKHITGESYFTFRLIDEFGVMQIAAWGHRYLSDSVFMTKMDGTLPNQFVNDGGGILGFKILEDDKEANDSLITRKFLLFLPDVDGKPYHDTDTLILKYKSIDYCFDYFLVQYNEEIQHEGAFKGFMQIVKK